MIIAGYLLAIVIGISLGLIGGGGSILTVPILVYLFGVSATLATGYSLFIVGITSLVGAARYYLSGFVNIKKSIVFAVPSVTTLLLTRQFFLPAIPDELLRYNTMVLTKDLLIMLVFACLMVVASFTMIRKSNIVHKNADVNNLRISMIGLCVGFLTGFLGAGGGFLIIPSLFFFAGLDMKQSVGTSLFIISINSIIGFIHDIINGEVINYPLLFSVSACAISGMIAGTILSKKIPGEKLKPAFGWFVFIMGLYIILRETLL